MPKYIASLIVLALSIPAVPSVSEELPGSSGSLEETVQTAAAAAAPSDYQIAPEDVLQIDVWGEPQLTRLQVQVTPDGKINVPFIGPMRVSGKTIQEVVDAIAESYVKEQILIAPKVNVTLISMHRPKVRVLGWVNRPGVVEFKEGDTVMEAIAEAGSYREGAWLEEATLTRKDSAEPIHIDLKALFLRGDMSQNLKLEKGDTIFIPEDTINKYYVLGEVNRPGLYQLKENVTVLSAISLAGGPTERGKLKGTVVIRGDLKNPQKLPVNIASLIERGDVKEDVALAPGDVVFVPETNKPDWGKISQVLQALISVSYLRRYGLF